MKMLPNKTFRFLLVAIATVAADAAGATQLAANDMCQLYGYAPRTGAYAQCRMNVRHYWNTGPCSDARFAAVHLRYCNLIRPLDF
jgi:hypothetical protein